MKLAACINHVPDTAAKINVAADRMSIDKTGVTYVINPYDEFAVEECLRLKEKNRKRPGCCSPPGALLFPSYGFLSRSSSRRAFC